jgi:hypothetical protein
MEPQISIHDRRRIQLIHIAGKCGFPLLAQPSEDKGRMLALYTARRAIGEIAAGDRVERCPNPRCPNRDLPATWAGLLAQLESESWS